jgi:RNA polymerase sigma-70 factor (ECF subfamily)
MTSLSLMPAAGNGSRGPVGTGRAPGEGSPWSFEEIFQEWQTPIYTYILRLVGDREQAEDLTQETFLKAFCALPKMGAGLKLAAWLYRIGTNTAFDALRRSRLIAFLRFADLEYELAGTQAQDPQVLCETRELIRAALRRMPERYRIALLLYRVEGRSPAEIARTLGVAPSGIKTYLHRATASFLQHYTDLGGEVTKDARRTCSRTRENKAS